jgi:hypothetical protein
VLYLTLQQRFTIPTIYSTNYVLYGFDSRPYQIFWEVIDLERGPFSLVSTIEELLERKIAVPVKKTENTAVGIRHAEHVALSIH